MYFSQYATEPAGKAQKETITMLRKQYYAKSFPAKIFRNNKINWTKVHFYNLNLLAFS